MSERNLLNEGFIFNTRDNEGAISGTQIVTQQQIAGLVDGDTSTDVYTLTPGQFTVLDADLGARYKINRIELYTDETQPLNFSMLISEDGIGYREVTMTGSPGLYTGDIPDSTVSGAPQFFRYQHNAAALRNVREWRVVNDQTLVDFGPGGNLDSITIDDAPIGNPSTVPEPLELVNNYSKIADAHVFVDRTFNDAEDQIEISKSINGPYVGRGNNSSTQPLNTGWDKGSLQNLRIVPSGTFSVDFSQGTAQGWGGFLMDSLQVVNGFLQGLTTAASGSAFILQHDFESGLAVGVDAQSQFIAHGQKLAFAAVDVDTIKVQLQIPPQEQGNLIHGPRLFWSNHEIETSGPFFYRDQLSTLSTTPKSNFNNQVQEFIFEVGKIPTWSGTIRGFAIQPFAVVSGSIGGQFVRMGRLDAVNSQAESAGGSFVALDFRPVTSGSFSSPFTDTDVSLPTNHRSIVDFRHTVSQDCIITKLRWLGIPSFNLFGFTVSLCRPRVGSNFPQIGSNFDAIVAAQPTFFGPASRVFQEIQIYWPAKKGDVFLFSYNTTSAAGLAFRVDADSKPGDIFFRTTPVGLNTLSDIENLLNNNNDWVSSDGNLMFEYEAIATELDRSPVLGPTASGGYYPSGIYRTPVFDTGLRGNPSCLDFDAVIPVGTSIDASGGVDASVVEARASNIPPETGLGLGEIGIIAGTSPTAQNNMGFEAAFLGANTSVSPNDTNQINFRNPIVSQRLHGSSTGSSAQMTQNLGATLLYHREKEEYWVVNVLLSGTNPFAPNDARPTWDVFDAFSGEYKETRHLTGSIFYSYSHPEAGVNSNSASVFEPSGFTVDYDRGVMYLIQREDAFFVGSNSYYGLITDLNGNFLNVYMLSTQLGSPNSIRWETSRDWTLAPDLVYPPLQNPDITGAKGVFFLLNSDINGDSDGKLITAAARGTDLDPATGFQWINEVNFDSIPGLEFMDNSDPDGMSLAFCPVNGLIYVTIFTLGNEGPNTYHPHIFALRPSYNSSTEQFEYSLEIEPTECQAFGGPIGERIGGFGRASNLQSFSRLGARPEAVPNTAGDDSTHIRLRQVGAHTSLVYNESRDTFVALMNWRMLWNARILGTGEFPSFNDRSWSLLSEGGAGTVSGTVLGGLPAIPRITDGLYGTVSGTLKFNQLATGSLLFPLGRFAQVEYVLNSNADYTRSPELLKSQICQGLSVGQIPAGESRTIYLRTNIPESQGIGDQVGRLKAFWELEE